MLSSRDVISLAYVESRTCARRVSTGGVLMKPHAELLVRALDLTCAPAVREPAKLAGSKQTHVD